MTEALRSRIWPVLVVVSIVVVSCRLMAESPDAAPPAQEKFSPSVDTVGSSDAASDAVPARATGAPPTQRPSIETTAGPPRETRSRPFTAQLLILEPDWSTSPSAQIVARDLDAALYGVSIPKELKDNVIGNGPQILFSSRNVGFYQPESAAQLVAWLEQHKLIRRKLEFADLRTVALAPGGFEGARGRRYQAREARLDDAGVKFTTDEAERPFVRNELRWSWRVREFVRPANVQTATNTSASFQIAASLKRVQEGPGQDDSNDTDLFSNARTFSVRGQEALFVSALPWDWWAPLYPGAITAAPIAEQGYAVLMLVPARARLDYKVMAELHIPNRVEEIALLTPQPFVEVPADANLPAGAPPADVATADAAPAVQNPASAADPNVATAIRVGAGTSQTPLVAVTLGSDARPALAALREENRLLEAQALALAQELRQRVKRFPRGAKYEEKRAALRDAVEAAFAAGQRLHAAELAEFQSRVSRLQQLIDQSRGNAGRIVDRRVEELLNPDVQWPAPAAEGIDPNDAAGGTTPGMSGDPRDGRNQPTARVRKPRRLVNKFREAGIVSKVRENGLLVISCKEPGTLSVGDELCLTRISAWSPKSLVGWVEIVEVVDDETVIGRPEMVRIARNNRYVVETPQEGDGIDRPEESTPRG